VEKNYIKVFGKEELNDILFGKKKYFYEKERKNEESFYLRYLDDEYFLTKKEYIAKVEAEYVDEYYPPDFEKEKETLDFEDAWDLDSFHVYKINKVIIG
jgi:hypothetical protein